MLQRHDCHLYNKNLDVAKWSASCYPKQPTGAEQQWAATETNCRSNFRNSAS